MTFTPHGFLFNNVYLHVYYCPSTFVGLVAKRPVCKFQEVRLRELEYVQTDRQADEPNA